MTNLEVILKALATGAGGGSRAVAEAYAVLRETLRDRLSGRESARQALEAVETSPGVWQPALGEEVSTAGADRDEEVVAAAQRVLDLSSAPAPPKYRVDVRNSKGVQIGDHNTQHNTF
ncbi:RIP homotypic interaction motif-containing protein [Actinoplanes sp. NPDC051861]|uniref:RIP homotypic interaction motif-containing protein n=1 Tax=Actinoplanes sp. NPDC051861 TaxID=3155170 RepID=UPI00343E337B